MFGSDKLLSHWTQLKRSSILKPVKKTTAQWNLNKYSASQFAICICGIENLNWHIKIGISKLAWG